MNHVTGHTLVFALIGHPVRHSLSPEMHNRLFRQLGVDAIYVAFDVFPERAGEVGAAVRTLDLRGANLTVPFKGAILEQLDQVTRAAAEARSVNCVIQHEGHLTGYNTDGEGFCRGFEERFGRSLAGRRVMILGAGGSARAIAAALADRGALSVVFLNRTLTNAEAACAHLTRYFPRTSFAARPLEREAFAEVAPGADLVVVCTSGPAYERIAALDLERLPPHAVWCDINYWQPDPPGLVGRRARGRPVQDGLPMLVHQGALSFELFTGLPVDPAHIRGDLL